MNIPPLIVELPDGASLSLNEGPEHISGLVTAVEVSVPAGVCFASAVSEQNLDELLASVKRAGYQPSRRSDSQELRSVTLYGHRILVRSDNQVPTQSF